MNFIEGKVHISYEARRSSLFAVTSLLVTVVRHNVTGHGFNWSSIEAFLGAWFVHAIALVLLSVLTGALVARWRRFFVGTFGEAPDYDDVQVHVCVTVLIAAIAIFFLAHWVPTDSLGIE
jgi:hypothetical protein